MTTYKERNELYRMMRHAFGHDRPGGSHSDINIDGFLNQLERFIDAKIQESKHR